MAALIHVDAPDLAGEAAQLGADFIVHSFELVHQIREIVEPEASAR
jgi:hypothetical protein